MLRKLLFLAFFGFLAIVLAGPVLAMLGVMLSFALVGFLVWLPIYGLCAGRRAGWTSCLTMARSYWHRTYDCVRSSARYVLSHAGPAALDRFHGRMRLTIAVIGESLSGAVIGGFVVYLSQREHSHPPVGVLVGGTIGLLVGLSHWRSVQRQTV